VPGPTYGCFACDAEDRDRGLLDAYDDPRTAVGTISDAAAADDVSRTTKAPLSGAFNEARREDSNR
jgi:hypothetical protein